MEIGVTGGKGLAGLAEGTSTKVFLAPGSIDRVRLGWRSGAAIEVAWDARVTPYVSVWVCNGDLGGERPIGIKTPAPGDDTPGPAAAPPAVEPGGRPRG